MVSYVIATSVFLLSTSVLLTFVVEPPGAPEASLEQQDLKAKATSVLDVLLGTPGYPATWDEVDVDAVARLGIVERGSSVRLDPAKFSALAGGRFSSPSSTNGVVDYTEAKEALGLTGYDFHIRGGPLLADEGDGSYGTQGMEAYRIAYVGDWSGVLASEASKREQGALASLDVGFVNLTRTSLTGLGDVFPDDKTTLKNNLVPLLGTGVAQTAITQGSGTAYGFYRVNATDFDDIVLPSLLPLSEKSLALSQTDSRGDITLGYTKSREIRAVVGTANLSDEVSATLTWKEYVETDRDAGDYGYVEVSPDAGATWISLTNNAATRSQDTVTNPQPAAVWRDRAVTISAANCAACLDNEEVLLAVHWVADGDNTRGTGWILDEVAVTGAHAQIIKKDFESPEYQLLVIGSNVDQTALTTSEVKYAIRDYVVNYGGRILVLGGDTQTQWLQPIFHVGMKTASPGVSNPDPTHPLLTTPNELDWQDFDHEDEAWDFGGGNDDDLFDMVVGTGSDQHILSVSTSGAFGPTEGGVILTSYLPWKMPVEQRLSFMANAITYGHYHHLYVEMGPEVPSDVPVASVSRTAIMEKNVDDGSEFIEMGIVLYLWRGDMTVASTVLPLPSAPNDPEAVPGNQQVTLTWDAPSYYGSGALLGYDVYRGTSPGNAVHIAYVALSSGRAYVDTHTASKPVNNGITYYYNVTARSTLGQGPSSSAAVATPATTPGAPGSLSATGAASQILLTWTDPASNGGAAITGFKVYRGTTSGFTPTDPIAEVGATNTYTDTGMGTGTSYYKLVAVNGMGDSAATSAVGGSPLSLPSAPATVAATPGVSSIDVTWAPASSVSAITAYQVYAGSSAESTAWLATVGGSTLTYSDTGLGSGVTRFYRVLAVNGDGSSSLSTAASATTLTLSTAPTAFTATGAPDSILLTWAAPTDPGSGTPTAYRIWRGTASGSLTLLATTTSGSNVSFLDAGLPDAATRYYQVAAVTSAGEGARASEASATTYDVATAPVLTLTPGVERVGLTWTLPASTGAPGELVTQYKIYRGTAPGASVHVASVTMSAENQQTNLLYQDTGLTGGTTYYYVVRAVTAAGEGAPSTEKSATALSPIIIGF
jgi:hypothetical protein